MMKRSRVFFIWKIHHFHTGTGYTVHLCKHISSSQNKLVCVRVCGAGCVVWKLQETIEIQSRIADLFGKIGTQFRHFDCAKYSCDENAKNGKMTMRWEREKTIERILFPLHNPSSSSFAQSKTWFRFYVYYRIVKLENRKRERRSQQNEEISLIYLLVFTVSWRRAVSSTTTT